MGNSFYEQEEFFKNRDLTHARDTLTQVFNRETIYEYIYHLLESDRPFSLLLIDIDNFKCVNDNFGHHVGDIVLQKVSENMVAMTNGCGVAGRYGGDEFIIVVPEIVGYDDIWHVCKNLTRGCNGLKIVELDNNNITLTVGVSRYPEDNPDFDGIMLKADKALYRGKQKGRNCFIIYLHEKHANIELKADSDKKLSPMDMHAKVTGMLSYSEDLLHNVHSLMKFLSTSLMLDRIVIQSTSAIVASSIHPLSYSKELKFIPPNIAEISFNSIGLCYINVINSPEHDMFHFLNTNLNSQGVTAVALVKIEAFGTEYGILRLESTNPDGRIWQTTELSYYEVFARTLGIILHYKGIGLDSLVDTNIY